MRTGKCSGKSQFSLGTRCPTISLLFLLFAGKREHGSLGAKTQGNIDQSGFLAVFVGHAHLIVRRRGVERNISLDTIGWVYLAQETNPLRHALAVTQFLVGLAVVVIDGHVGDDQISGAAIHGAQADQEKTILRNSGSGVLRDLGQPLRLEGPVDEMSHFDFVTQSVGTYGLPGFVPTSVQEKRGDDSRRE